MNKDPLLFVMANPDPEIRPEVALGHARIIATGRSDYPNQINNVLCFPGIFRGALDVRARGKQGHEAGRGPGDSQRDPRGGALRGLHHPQRLRRARRLRRRRAVGEKAKETGVARRVQERTERTLGDRLRQRLQHATPLRASASHASLRRLSARP